MTRIQRPPHVEMVDTIPSPRFQLGQIVYDHYPEQYIECWLLKWVVTEISWNARACEIEYEITRHDDVIDPRCINPERADEVNERHIDTVPRTLQESE